MWALCGHFFGIICTCIWVAPMWHRYGCQGDALLDEIGLIVFKLWRQFQVQQFNALGMVQALVCFGKGEIIFICGLLWLLHPPSLQACETLATRLASVEFHATLLRWKILWWYSHVRRFSPVLDEVPKVSYACRCLILKLEMTVYAICVC